MDNEKILDLNKASRSTISKALKSESEKFRSSV